MTIGFHYIDEFGDEHRLESRVGEYSEIYGSDLDQIGFYFNTFLSQIGYLRYNRCMLMEDLTEDERDALMDYLRELRGYDKDDEGEDEE